jgi:hypothetical protein
MSLNDPPHRILRALAAGVWLSAVACADPTFEPAPPGQLAVGTWGGDNAGVVVTDSAVHVHVGCTFGDMPGTIVLDAGGRFVVDGNYVLRAYPIVLGPALPAQFSGRVIGRTLVLAIAVNDTVENKVVALGPITVEFGRTPQMGPCPICRAPRRWP